MYVNLLVKHVEWAGWAVVAAFTGEYLLAAIAFLIAVICVRVVRELK